MISPTSSRKFSFGLPLASLADTVEIPNHQIKLVRFAESKEQISSLAIAQKASGDDSNLSVFRSDINKNGDPTRN